MRWYIQIDGVVRGPFEASQVQAAIEAGTSDPAVLRGLTSATVCQEGSKDWIQLRQSQFAALLPASASAIPRVGSQVKIAGIIAGGALVLIALIIWAMQPSRGKSTSPVDPVPIVPASPVVAVPREPTMDDQLAAAKSVPQAVALLSPMFALQARS